MYTTLTASAVAQKAKCSISWHFPVASITGDVLGLLSPAKISHKPFPIGIASSTRGHEVGVLPVVTAFTCWKGEGVIIK